MKKILCLLLVCSSLLMTSCGKTIKKTGINFFNYDDSEYGISNFLIPPGFLELYEYKNAGYYFYSQTDSIYEKTKNECFCYDQTLMCLKYDESQYILAKSYMFDNMSLNLQEEYRYGAYIFYENMSFVNYLKIKSVKYGRFPYQYTMAGYNDEINTLLFLGLYCADGFTNIDIFPSDFEEHVLTMYKEIYNFDD